MRVVRILTRANRGGPLRQLQALVPGLARLEISGPVWVGDPAEGEEDASDDLRAVGADLVRVPGLQRGIHPLRDRRALRWMRAALRREKPDVVHTHQGKAGALGRLAAAREGVPAVVHTLHGHHFEAPYPLGALARAAERRLARSTSALVVLSPRQRADVVTRWGIAPEDRVVEIGPGIDVAAFRAAVDPKAVEALRDRAGAGRRPVFLWIGRFVPAKDPLLLLDAWRSLPRGTAGGPALLAAGDGPLREAFSRRARTHGLSADVVLLGPVPDPWNAVAAADAVVLSSASEGTPIAVVEAHVLSKPVVATAVGGVPDLVRDGETGLLVPAGDPAAVAAAVERLAGDAALRGRLGAAAGREAGERYSAERLVTATAALYRRLLGRCGEGGPAGRPVGSPPC